METIDKFNELLDLSVNTFKITNDGQNQSFNHRFAHKDKVLIVNLSIINKPVHWTKGVFNRTEDGKFIFFLDFDYMKKEYLIGELKHLQEIFNLSTIHFFQSSEKGFHAVSFDKLRAKEYMEILDNSSCDQAFQYTPRKVSYRNWVLRNFKKGETAKPAYLCSFVQKSDREQSYAHWKYFSILYPQIKKFPLLKSDGIEKLTIVEYPTGMNT